MHSNKTPFPSRVAEQFLLRMPDGMRDRIKESAKANNRAMVGEIVHRLQDSFQREDAGTGAALNTISTADLLAELGRRCER